MADLLQAGIISTSRGRLRITDRAALEARACECYKAVKSNFDHVLPETPRTLRVIDSPDDRSSALAL